MAEFESADTAISPIAVVAFGGWNDAGQAATDAIRHLMSLNEPQVLGMIEPEEYYDFQDLRPTLERPSGEPPVIDWPHVEIVKVRPPGWDREAIVVLGPEPHLRWARFTTEIIDILLSYGVKTLVVLGAMLSDSPHTRPLPVSITTNRKTPHPTALPSDYSGPVGISAIVAKAADDVGLDSVSLWVSVPHYVADSPSPKAVFALLVALEDAVGQPIDADSLRDDVLAWQRGADEAVSDDEALSEYVAVLEHDADLVDSAAASGDSIAADFERYLRRRESND